MFSNSSYNLHLCQDLSRHKTTSYSLTILVPIFGYLHCTHIYIGCSVHCCAVALAHLNHSVYLSSGVQNEFNLERSYKKVYSRTYSQQ